MKCSHFRFKGETPSACQIGKIKLLGERCPRDHDDDEDSTDPGNTSTNTTNSTTNTTNTSTNNTSTNNTSTNNTNSTIDTTTGSGSNSGSGTPPPPNPDGVTSVPDPSSPGSATGCNIRIVFRSLNGKDVL